MAPLAGLAATLVSVSVLIGWATDCRVLKCVAPGLASMKVNTALALMLLGLSLGLISAVADRRRWVLPLARVAAVAVVLLGGGTLAEYIFASDFGIDQLLVRDTRERAYFPGRPSPASALTMSLLGLALCCHRRQSRGMTGLAQGLTLTAFAATGLALVGYVYGIDALYRMHPFSSMAVHTAATFVVLCGGVLSLQPNVALLEPLANGTMGGTLARRMLPAVFAIALSIGWLQMQAQQRQLFGLEFGLALYAILMVAVFSVLVWLVGRSLNRIDARHQQTALQLEQSQAELAHLLRVHTMNEMVAGIAHELNQPLSAISNFARGTVRHLRSGSSDQAALIEVANAIADESVRAADIVRSLKRFVKKCDAHWSQVDLNAVVQGAVRIVTGEARRRAVTLTLHCSEQLPKLIGDHVQLKQVVVNLLCNAIDAVDGQADRQIRIATRRISADEVEVVVEDRGCGLSGDMPARMFEPFFTTKEQGLGLGLAISRSLIDAHGGELRAESNRWHGATFRVVLPIERKGAHVQ